VLQVLRRTFATPIRRVPKQHRGRFDAAGRTVIAHVHPQAPRLGLTAPRFEHWHRRIVGMQFGGLEHVTAQGIDERIEEMEALADPLGERGTFQFDAFTCVDLRLAVQRLVISVLRYQHVCEQARAGHATGDWA